MTFYTAQLFTAKRGPLAQIWLAAHWERKLTKIHVFECNIETTIRDIISPKMKLGLRTSSHLFVGVVRIYSRKAKYLLADCSDALVKIKMAFRPGQTDMPLDGLEATLKAITLMEDFTAFDSQLPPLCTIDVVDHFSLNQCRSEEITLKDDFGSVFLNLVDFGDDSQSHHNGLLDMSFQSFTQHDDFGDENRGLDLLDFLTNSSENPECTDFILEEPQARSPEIAPLEPQREAERTEMGSPTRNETTLLDNEAEAFALEPVAVTSNSETKRGKRKRKLVVDQTKELTDERIRGQLLDYSDLVASLDMAPPTVQLMRWKESGAADKLFAHPCSTVAAPEIMTIFARSVFQVRSHAVLEEVEEMRRDGQAVQRDTGSLTTDDVRDAESSIDPETHDAQLTALEHMNDHPLENHSEDAQGPNSSEVTHPGLPSEDSMFVHPSFMQQESSLHTQSMLDSQDLEERRTTRRTQKLLDILRSNSDAAAFSLQALCEGGSRLRAATTFFSLLILKKLNAIQLHQSAPYEDISATPGDNFYKQQPNRVS